MEIIKKGTASRTFFKRPQKHGGHLILCYIGLYTILQLQIVCARHHDLGKLIGTNNNNNNDNFNDIELNNLQLQAEQQQHKQSSVNAQIIHNQQEDQQPILKQPPILDQKITQQLPSDIDAPNGAVLAKDDGKYTRLLLLYSPSLPVFQFKRFCLSLDSLSTLILPCFE